MSKVLVSCRVESNLIDRLKQWAEEENRTISNLIESLLLQEKQRREGCNVTLQTLSNKLDALLIMMDNDEDAVGVGVDGAARCACSRTSDSRISGFEQ